VDGIKILIVVALFGIVASLGKAMFHMSSSRTTDSIGQSAMMARALTVRIGLSVALFVLLMCAWYFGGISPHGMN
jgi:membrane associated rhomboid family serine protease